MGTCHSGSLPGLATDEVTVSVAAVRTYRRLKAALAGRITTHAYRDGGLICEDRTSPARPRMWRIAADGGLLADSSYSFARGTFIRVPLPGEAVIR